MTTTGEMPFYLSLRNTQLPMESQFISKLDIVTGTLKSDSTLSQGQSDLVHTARTLLEKPSILEYDKRSGTT